MPLPVLVTKQDDITKQVEQRLLKKSLIRVLTEILINLSLGIECHFEGMALQEFFANPICMLAKELMYDIIIDIRFTQARFVKIQTRPGEIICI